MKATLELERKAISFKLVRHSGSAHTAIDAAKEINLTVGQIVKTLAFSGKIVGIILVLIPGDKKFDRRKIADFVHDKTVDLLEREQVVQEVGYPVGLVTPFGTKKKFKIYLEKSIRDKEIIGISSGELGAEIVMKSQDLIKASGAIPGDFC